MKEITRTAQYRRALCGFLLLFSFNLSYTQVSVTYNAEIFVQKDALLYQKGEDGAFPGVATEDGTSKNPSKVEEAAVLSAEKPFPAKGIPLKKVAKKIEAPKNERGQGLAAISEQKNGANFLCAAPSSPLSVLPANTCHKFNKPNGVVLLATPTKKIRLKVYKYFIYNTLGHYAETFCTRPPPTAFVWPLRAKNLKKRQPIFKI